MTKERPSKIDAIRGMNDILPAQSWRWQRLEAILQAWLSQYGYQNVRTPVLEATRLFARGIGEVTDIVEKEMYTFRMGEDPAGEQLTMRPEFTAGMVRAVIEHSLTYERPQRLYSIGPVFRHERPQKGRYRQFHQLSVEALGFAGPDTDAEQIVMLARLWKMLGLHDLRLEINSLGQPDERLAHREALIAYFQAHEAQLDSDARRRLHSNPLRILDTKNPDMQALVEGAPQLSAYLGEASQAHFQALCHRLTQAGIAYTVNPRLVRGLDYYNLTVFEWVTDRLGAQGTVCGGGRYDGLCTLLGGQPTPAIGFGLGIERLLLLIEQVADWVPPPETQLYIVHQGEGASEQAAVLAEQCRDAGWRVLVHPGKASFKSQFKRADASGADYALIIGESEFQAKTVAIKPLRLSDSGNMQEQVVVPQSALLTTLSERKRHGL